VQLHTRIITNPFYPKALLDTLQKSIEQYEQTFGTISGAKKKQMKKKWAMY
jgi:hypothetical protein